MSILIVGGDRLGNIPNNLKSLGFTEIEHLSGRKMGHIAVNLPREIDAILVFIDYVNHGLALKIKKDAQKKGVKTIFARRSWSNIAKTWEAFKTG
ncbi:DUF2325 domain-containing protein [Moorella sp. Hama-1]|uniref:DUF2325 domain-containing protein n=1 Tax=Moorella sp. Hama-1 TaxID=2138101 RepID=UPI000D65ADE4|nr:DUF2325 domain-containing protein [Moorella sp. Hama-1]BCV21647.1 dihydroorotate dehydrogenase [Moorella sp. Hama-1]